jgi:thiol-disulfide isomerase/thioredoxin|tara:strand:+ start:3956 stop:4447 length:492 start_codon:yes stop_codon:yes gene_type:complete
MIRRNIILILLLAILFISYQNSIPDKNLDATNSQINNNISINMPSSELSSLNLANDQYLVLNLWASWCIPCKNEVKELKKIQSNENYIVVGLLVEDSIKNGEDFIVDNNINYENILNESEVDLIISQFIWSGIPTTVVLNKDFQIISTFNGEIVAEDIFNITD